MSSWEEIVQNYIINYFDNIKDTTKPLKDRFGIEYFTYHKIDHAGNYTVLVDRPEWAEQYIERKLYSHDPFLRHSSMYSSGLTFVHHHGSAEYQEAITRAGKEVLHLNTCVMLIQKNLNSVEFFGFSSNIENKRLRSLYLNQKYLLESFAKHFKERLIRPIHTMEEEKISLSLLKGADFFTHELVSPGLERNQEIDFLSDLSSKEIALSKKLSKREKECLKHLTEGATYKEIAQSLDLSPRTVESYMENIKNKLSCSNRKELITMGLFLKKNMILP